MGWGEYFLWEYILQENFCLQFRDDRLAYTPPASSIFMSVVTQNNAELSPHADSRCGNKHVR